ncbi:uncharacterized protein BDR25DRAFT_390641 [Lindgomyces ingoldianus]|uniref:Uncharacterized protein n=1 Tax=Lindgomyces ingoldianus TaxID=673940 RepID=A0ACB6RCG5_9PLEO|nr:uncharacterized protein BDR25DRAFT_390641 [Lindgomyces ingoldianus]KAF2476939.1 hypothetical protein BDR25DRAFT_390641 [Lindgomyces ingoldianus]
MKQVLAIFFVFSVEFKRVSYEGQAIESKYNVGARKGVFESERRCYLRVWFSGMRNRLTDLFSAVAGTLSASAVGASAALSSAARHFQKKDWCWFWVLYLAVLVLVLVARYFASVRCERRGAKRGLYLSSSKPPNVRSDPTRQRTHPITARDPVFGTLYADTRARRLRLGLSRSAPAYLKLGDASTGMLMVGNIHG